MPTTSPPAPRSPARIGGLLITLATVVVLAVMTAVVAAISGDMPAQVATHWGASGAADGFTSRDDLWTLLAIPVVLGGVLLPVAFMGDRLPAGMHWLTGLPVGTCLGVGTIVVGSLLPQRGLADAATAPFPGWLIPVGVVLGLVATVLAARLSPTPSLHTTTRAAPAGAVRADLPPGALVVWHGTTPAAPALKWLAAGVVALGAWMAWAVSWWLVTLFVPLAVLLLASMQFDVTVGPAGVRASAALFGWPHAAAPLDTITSACSTTTRFVDFGGWGIRVNPGQSKTGVITRFGPALQVDRTDGSALVVSMANPDIPAAVVNTLLDRRGGPSGDAGHHHPEASIEGPHHAEGAGGADDPRAGRHHVDGEQ